jgi:hypothetical protein
MHVLQERRRVSSLCFSHLKSMLKNYQKGMTMHQMVKFYFGANQMPKIYQKKLALPPISIDSRERKFVR